MPMWIRMQIRVPKMVRIRIPKMVRIRIHNTGDRIAWIWIRIWIRIINTLISGSCDKISDFWTALHCDELHGLGQPQADVLPRVHPAVRGSESRLQLASRPGGHLQHDQGGLRGRHCPASALWYRPQSPIRLLTLLSPPPPPSPSYDEENVIKMRCSQFCVLSFGGTKALVIKIVPIFLLSLREAIF